MKKLLLTILVLFSSGSIALAAPPWIYQRTILPEINNAYDIGTSSLLWRNIYYAGNLVNTALSNGCASWSSGVLTSLGVPCGSGGGSGGGTFSTTTSNVTGELINYPNNNTDIVTVGNTATTSAKVYLDPNTQRYYFNGTMGIASTTPAAKLSVVGSDPTSLVGIWAIGAGLPIFADRGTVSGGFVYERFGANGTFDWSWNGLSTTRSLGLNNSLSGDVLTVTRAGNLGIGSTTPGFPLSVTGAITATGNLDFNKYATRKLVVTGDSITAANYATDWTKAIVLDPTTTDPFFSKSNLVTYATVGEQVCTMVGEYTTNGHSQRPIRNDDDNYFVLEGGINDLFASVDAGTIYGCISSLWASARADGYKVVAMTLMPDGRQSVAQKAQWTALNQLIRSNPTKYDYLMQPDLVLNNPFDSNYWQSDLVHPTATSGALEMAQVFKNAISKKPYFIIPNFSTSTRSDLWLNPMGAVGVGTSSPSFTALFNVFGTSTIAKDFEVVNSASTTLLTVTESGNTGVSTSSPGSTFAIGSIANFTTGTTTLYSSGLNMTGGGCFAINGVCQAGGGGSTNPAGSDTQVQFNNSGSFGANANIVIDNANTRFGIGTSTPSAKLAVSGSANNVGIWAANATVPIRADRGSGVSGGFVWHDFWVNNVQWWRIQGDVSTNAYEIVNASGTVATAILQNGNFGVGTTSPGTTLSVGNTTGINFTTGTSTFNSTGGVNLAAGCYAVAGTCITLAGGSVTSVATNNGLMGGPVTTSGTIGLDTSGLATNMVTYWDGSKLGATSTPFVTAIVASSTTATSTFAGGITGPGSFTLNSSNGAVGIGSSSPSAALSVAGAAGSVSAVGIWSRGASVPIFADRGSVTGTFVYERFGANNTWDWDMRSTTARELDFVNNFTGGTLMTLATSSVGIGTSTPFSNDKLTVSASGSNQNLTLTDGTLIDTPWNVSNKGGDLFIATSSQTTGATTSPAAVTIIGTGRPVYAFATSSSQTVNTTVGFSTLLNLGPNPGDVATGSTTIRMNTLQIESFEGATAHCTFINSSGALTTISGTCNN